jgi:hypothetical protein
MQCRLYVQVAADDVRTCLHAGWASGWDAESWVGNGKWMEIEYKMREGNGKKSCWRGFV